MHLLLVCKPRDINGQVCSVNVNILMCFVIVSNQTSTIDSIFLVFNFTAIVIEKSFLNRFVHLNKFYTDIIKIDCMLVDVSEQTVNFGTGTSFN